MSEHNKQDAGDRMWITAGPYNLVDGKVPQMDGEPIEPWSAQAAYQRFQQVAPKVSIPVSPDVVLLPSNSNDAWLKDDMVLRVCWRGDRKRLLKEAQVMASLPLSIPHPRVREWGMNESFSWMLTDYVPGATLASVWATTAPDQLRAFVLQFAHVLRTLHEWTPPTDITALLDDCQGQEANDALALVGRCAIPLPVSRTRHLISFAQSMPFVDERLLDAVDERLLDLAACHSGEAQPQVMLHGDAAPVNVMVRNGHLQALLDFEWAGLGARDLELVSPLHWIGLQSSEQSAHQLLEWLREGYPELFNVPDLDRRMWLGQLAFYLRGLIVWPPDRAEEELPTHHPVRQLRILVDHPIHLIG
jgi:aminoglycoside phosphotransferase (APT) family kinase protein